MNGMQSKRDRRQTVGRIYTAIESGRAPPRDITYDSEGVAALVGQQGTNEVWYAERIAAEDDEMCFRVLLVVPSKTKGFQMTRRGVPEYGERLTNCQYFVGDVSVPRFGSNAALGRALRPIQEKFRQVQRSGGLDKGTVRRDGDLNRVYDEWFADL